mmetsp:Transcript_10257/g.30619  ORF Transcript_10257/g.30619 Transcript_10257/m.30619 type:complete len:236 (+) Transcript_10257:952-1659(+)
MGAVRRSLGSGLGIRLGLGLGLGLSGARVRVRARVGVRAIVRVRVTERVLHKHIRHGRERLGKGLLVRGLSGVEAHVLQEEDLARGHLVDEGVDGVADAVRRQGARLPQDFLDHADDRLHRVLLLEADALRPPAVGDEEHLGIGRRQRLHRRLDGRDLARHLSVVVQVDPHQDALAFELGRGGIGEGPLGAQGEGSSGLPRRANEAMGDARRDEQQQQPCVQHRSPGLGLGLGWG